jgi:serine/threonine-protein kinase
LRPFESATLSALPLSRFEHADAGIGSVPHGAPSHVGPYRLERRLGRGALGEVHLAVHTGTGLVVALKTLLAQPGCSDAEAAEARARFLAEAATAQRLSHPAIVKVHASGDDAGVAWLAMELLRGCDLDRYTRAPRLLPEALVVRIGEQLARALAHAHAQGVVHRDIKPANVMFDLPRGTVKLTDFGIAGLADMSCTRTGVVLGTPLYMAPEQLAGAAADARGDQYSLGVLLFHLLSGRLPHEATSLGELLRQVARESAPSLLTLRPALPAPLAALVATALQKQPAARHAGMGALADALADAQADLQLHDSAACAP